MNIFWMPKRVLSIVLSLLLGLAIALTVPQMRPAQAAVPFYWDSINVDLDVQPNGDMLVAETQKYVFESDYSNQRYRYIRLDKVDGIQNVSVQENNQILDSTVTTEDNQVKIQWSHPLKAPETPTFVLKYRVVGGLHVDESTTQVFWRAIFVDRSAPVKTAKVTVHLPEVLAGSVTSFKSFDAPANARQVDAQTFEFIAQQELPPQQTLEVQVSFPSQILNLPQPKWQQGSANSFSLTGFFLVSVISFFGLMIVRLNSQMGQEQCPKCNTRSLKRKKVQILSRPTRYRDGQKQENWDCYNCHHHTESIVVIPLLSADRSSHYGGGGHDGGGHGGGGGCGGGGGGCGGGG